MKASFLSTIKMRAILRVNLLMQSNLPNGLFSAQAKRCAGYELGNLEVFPWMRKFGV